MAQGGRFIPSSAPSLSYSLPLLCLSRLMDENALVVTSPSLDGILCRRSSAGLPTAGILSLPKDNGPGCDPSLPLPLLLERPASVCLLAPDESEANAEADSPPRLSRRAALCKRACQS